MLDSYHLTNDMQQDKAAYSAPIETAYIPPTTHHASIDQLAKRIKDNEAVMAEQKQQIATLAQRLKSAVEKCEETQVAIWYL